MIIEDLKVGHTVFCIGGGFRMECRVVETYISTGRVKITDDNVTVTVYMSELEFDKSYNRNKLLESLNIQKIMSGEEVENLLYDLKSISVQFQEYEVAARLRYIENSFNKRHGKEYIEPTYENLVIEIGKAMEELSKNGQIYRSVRAIKLILLLN